MNLEQKKCEGTWVYRQFSQNQLILVYVSFLRHITSVNKLDIRSSPEQKELYGLSDTKCNMQLLLNRLMNSGTERQVVDAALVLLFRTVSIFGLESLTLHTVPRLLLSSLVIANICFEDDYVLLSQWQRMANCAWTLEEMRHMIYEQLTLLNYMTHVELDEIRFLQQHVLIPYFDHSFDEMALRVFVEQEQRVLAGEDFVFPNGEYNTTQLHEEDQTIEIIASR